MSDFLTGLLPALGTIDEDRRRKLVGSTIMSMGAGMMNAPKGQVGQAAMRGLAQGASMLPQMRQAQQQQQQIQAMAAGETDPFLQKVLKTNPKAYVQHKLQQRMKTPTATFETVQNPYGRGGVGQMNSQTGQISGYQGPGKIETVKTGDGLFTLNPDGTLGNRLGDVPQTGSGGTRYMLIPTQKGMARFDRATGSITPVSKQEADALASGDRLLPPSQDPTLQGEKTTVVTTADEQAKADVKSAAQRRDKAGKAFDINRTLEGVEDIIGRATGSAAGALADEAAAAAGKSTKGAQAIAELKIIEATLMLNMPRMEGPQSDRDVDLYRNAAARLGDPLTPRETKIAAVNMIRALNQKYIDMNAGGDVQAFDGEQLVPEPPTGFKVMP